MAKIMKTNQNLATAYDLVLADLTTKLVHMSEGRIELGSLGNLIKKYRQTRNPLNGKVYGYYQVSFKASSILKKALDK